jgi:hypothetical protein
MEGIGMATIGMLTNKEFADNIIGVSRHQFIYGRNGEERKEFLQDVVSKFPIILDASSPIGIYIFDKGLPEINKDKEKLDYIAINVFYERYLDYLISSNIMDTTLDQIDEKILNKRSEMFLLKINQFFGNKEKKSVSSFRELKNTLEEIRDSYYCEFVKYINSGNMYDFSKDLRIKYINIEAFVKLYKKMINIQSHLSVIFDQQQILSLGSQKATNKLVGCRINSDLSMKIACEPEEWKTHYDNKGNLIAACHDYGTIDLDGSLDEHVKKMKKKWQTNSD